MLTKAEAAAIDEELMSSEGFSLDQLMELAGLSVAASLATEYPTTTHPRVLVLAGPGNNGGDGLVAARHLFHWGYSVRVAYPRATPRPPFLGLVTQLRSLGVELLQDVSALGPEASAWGADVVLDSMFGFSFRPPLRPPFDALVAALTRRGGDRPACAAASSPPVVVAVDVPSGWDVELGDTESTGFSPDMLVSLTAPKRCAAFFTGAHHYLGGRFVPPALAARYGLAPAPYLGAEQCVRLGGSAAVARGASRVEAAAALPGMRQSYDAGELVEVEAPADPLDLFRAWFADAAAHPGVGEPNAMLLSTADARGTPSARVVLLKALDEGGGFTFFTNYQSRKGEELGVNPAACLTFFWGPLQRQVRVEGTTTRVSAAESEAYFHSRPRGSQVGAWASAQSRRLEGGGREVLERRVAELEAKYAGDGTTVPYPQHWGGYRLVPQAIEFWQGRPSRLHDRLVYYHTPSGGWDLARLQP